MKQEIRLVIPNDIYAAQAKLLDLNKGSPQWGQAGAGSWGPHQSLFWLCPASFTNQRFSCTWNVCEVRMWVQKRLMWITNLKSDFVTAVLCFPNSWKAKDGLGLEAEIQILALMDFTCTLTEPLCLAMMYILLPPFGHLLYSYHKFLMMGPVCNKDAPWISHGIHRSILITISWPESTI